MDSPNFSNPQQERIYGRLNSLVSPGAAAFWRDACRLMEMELPLESTTHFVGHSLREIESSLRAVLKPFWEPSEQPSKKKKASGDDTHKAQIKAVLQALEIPETSDVARKWLSLPGRNSEYGLHRRAHRDDLASPRPVDEKFRQFWSDIQAVLDQVLDRFETRYSDIRRLLDELLTKSEPEKKDLDTLRLHIPNSRAGLGYFFEQLKAPGWLNPLWQKGFFKNPPEPEVDLERGGIGCPPWSQSRYLVRMASQKPEIVLEIAQEILKTGTKNILVHEDLAEAACAMPPELAARWVEQETKWLKEQDNLYFSLLENLGELIVYLAESEQVDAALELARELLAVMPNQEGDYLTRVRTRCDDYYYRQILTEYVPKLREVAEEDTLKLLCELLDNAVRLSQSHKEDDSSEDHSRSWRSAIEEHHQNLSDVRNLLVNVVRDITEKIAKNEPTKVRGLVQSLESYNWRIFQRMALHLIRQCPDVAPDLVVEHLTNHQRFSNSDLKEDYEYVLLLKERFAYLAPEEQQKILSWIAEGFDLNKLSLRSQKKRELHQKYWQRNKLTPISEHLSSEWQQQYQNLVDELGKPKFRELVFDVYTPDQEDYSSLTKATELALMSDEELISYLDTWQPSSGEFFPDQLSEKLRQELTRLVESNPERFVLQNEKFKDLKPRYIAAIFSGLLSALRQETGIREEEKPQLSWSLMLDFCSWVLEQSKANSEYSNSEARHNSDWSWAGEVVVDLLKVGLEVTGKNEIPFHLRREFWEVLRPLFNDHSKSILCDNSYHSSKLINLSFNITSSAAMHTVIHYAFWVQQHSDGEGQAVQNFDKMPEVREILESHLVSNKDSSPVIQAVYGYRFQSLLTLDLDWTTQNVEMIFPKDESLRELRDAAWEGYITYHSPDAKLFNILREEYSHAIEQIDKSIYEWQHLPESGESLAEHLMQFYWNGTLNLGESDNLLEGFFAKAPEQHRQYFMRRIGWLVSNNQSTIEPEYLERLKQFWEWRVSMARSSPAPDLHTSELKTFGKWFASGKFDNNWAITQLKEVLRLANYVNNDSILRHIAALAPSQPLDAFECLRLIADRTLDLIYLDQESSRIILSTALQCEDEKTRKAAKDLINRWLVRGIDFRNLLSDEEV
ncbi:MAG: hypothetical protein RIM23_04945 [Coleofasciculus sp. G3-WIS-01]|uniref:hypothetical protein n=1 Tax=Coleofasciculus sp. G3-WIS-01 TaxID=3069528 RepID=UPI0032FA0FE4